MTTLHAAVIQVNAGTEMDRNIESACDLARRAVDDGAQLITTPENVSMIAGRRRDIIAKAHTEENHPALAAFRKLAEETGTWFLAGSLHIKLTDSDDPDQRLANRQYLIAPDGSVVARYTKIHMFDVTLPNGENYKESKVFAPGDQASVVQMPWGKLGLSICYDLRFPPLYQALAMAGADVIVIPSAFTRVTGRAHWHVLLRARAIETGCFILAAAQCGEHAGGRKTYGHSLIVAPWGDVLADTGEDVGYAVQPLDLARVAESRGRVPSLQHHVAFSGPDLIAPRQIAAE